MKTCPKMQKLITAIAKKHRLDLAAWDTKDYLRLSNSEWMDLVIEAHGKNLVLVGHYHMQNGDQVADPDCLFFTGYGPWVPLELHQVLGHTLCATLTKDSSEVEKLSIRNMRDVGIFCEKWATNIRR